jgi:hypothetical protein
MTRGADQLPGFIIKGKVFHTEKPLLRFVSLFVLVYRTPIPAGIDKPNISLPELRVRNVGINFKAFTVLKVLNAVIPGICLNVCL